MVQAPYPRRRSDVLHEVQADGSGMLYDPRTRFAIALSASAVAVWTACDGMCSPTAITAALADTYDAPLGVIRQDVDALLADLEGRGLLVGGHGRDA